MRRVLGCALLLGLMAAGCSDGDGGSSGGPRATVPKASTTTAPADPYAIPDTIDIAYVQRVLDKLYEIEGDAVRIIVAERALVPAAVEKLQAIFLADELNAQLDGWTDIIREGELTTFASDPRAVSVVVRQLPEVTASCISIRTTEDPSAGASTPQEPYANLVSLGRKSDAQDRGRANPTPWMIARELVPETPDQSLPCE